MAVYKGIGIPPFTGTKNGICIYKRAGQYCMRTKSSLTGKRVKKDPKFRRTMQYAGWLADASRIASVIYRLLPSAQKHFPFFRALTGEAMQLLKAGKTVAEAAQIMQTNCREKINVTKPGREQVHKAGAQSIKKMIAQQQSRECFNLQLYYLTHNEIRTTGKRIKRRRGKGASRIHSPPLIKPEEGNPKPE